MLVQGIHENTFKNRAFEHVNIIPAKSDLKVFSKYFTCKVLIVSIINNLRLLFSKKYFQCKRVTFSFCSHQQFSIIATFYRPPATTISFYSTTSSPEKKKTSSNRLGTPLSRGVEKPERPSALQPTTESRVTFCWGEIGDYPPPPSPPPSTIR